MLLSGFWGWEGRGFSSAALSSLRPRVRGTPPLTPSPAAASSARGGRVPPTRPPFPAKRQTRKVP